MVASKSIKAFYSWQSDLPDHTNRSAIRRALKSASRKIESTQSDLSVIVDEATRDTSGSPNIPMTIVAKIEAADLVVADITSITRVNAGRSCPNPNVTFELGYAVAYLGWERVIMLFNEAFGVFPGDLPFDFSQHRANRYNYPEEPSTQEISNLEQFLVNAIRAIISKNPKRPEELRGLSVEKVQRSRDIQNIEWFLSSIHLPTLDEFILDMPGRMSDQSLWFWEGFRELMFNSLFYIYDSDLSDAVGKFATNWFATMSHSEEYDPAANGSYYVFYNPLDMPLSDKRQSKWDKMDLARRNMRQHLDRILHIVRTDYIEVDISETNSRAWKQYREYHQRVQRHLENEDDEDDD